MKISFFEIGYNRPMVFGERSYEGEFNDITVVDQAKEDSKSHEDPGCIGVKVDKESYWLHDTLEDRSLSEKAYGIKEIWGGRE